MYKCRFDGTRWPSVNTSIREGLVSIDYNKNCTHWEWGREFGQHRAPGGGTPKGSILTGYYIWFQPKYLVHVSSNQKSHCSSHISTFGLFGKFWWFLEIISCSQRISEIYMDIGNFEDMSVLKLEFEIKIVFYPFNTSFNFLKLRK